VPERAAAILDVEVQPRAPRTEMVGWREGRLRVRLAAPPVEGAANAALVALLADTLDLPKRQVRIATGATGRRKQIRIDGLDRAAVAARLGREEV
jgi:uncharacterized protein (TIGR00251 family)